MSDFNADGTVQDAVIDGLCAGMVPGDHTDVQRTLVAMAKEIRQRRAADLTDEEREALAWARKLLSRSPLGPTMRPRALAALSKLLAAGGGK